MVYTLVDSIVFQVLLSIFSTLFKRLRTDDVLDYDTINKFFLSTILSYFFPILSPLISSPIVASMNVVLLMTFSRENRGEMHRGMKK